MKQQILIILCGEAFSGKSTLAKRLAQYYEAKVVGRDAIYFAMNEILALEKTPEEDDAPLWKNMWPIVVQRVKNQLSVGNSVVVDDNNLYTQQRDELREVARKAQVETVLVYLDIPKEILNERKQRNKIEKTRHDVPSAWLLEDNQLFERPTDGEKPVNFAENMDFELLIEQLDKSIAVV
jgi:predicted kinase